MSSPDDVPTRIVGDGAPPRPQEQRDRVRARRDDMLAIAGLLAGISIAFLGRKVIIELAGGIGLGLGGALLAIRGGKPIQGRTWLVLALVLAVFAAMGGGALELYEEWSAGQWFAEGAPTGATPNELYRLYRTLAAMRIACLAGGLTYLLGAVVNKLSGDENLRK
jgi:hypothetical protein